MDESNFPITFGEQWFSTALKSIGDAVIATDHRGRIVFLNPVAEVLTGWAEAEARGRDLIDVFPIINETTRKPVENPVADVLASGTIVGLANHTVLIARDGTERPIDDSAAPITDEHGRIQGVVLVFRDVTGKRRDDEIRNRLAAIVESSDDAIIAKDLRGIITSWNEGAERILGYSAGEIIGQHVSTLIPPVHIEDVTRILERVRRGERVEHYQTKRRRKDGTIIDVSLTVSPIKNGYGVIIGASKIARDITAQKRAEEERKEADRRKDEFLAMLAHELRNPISAISNAVQLFGMPGMEEELEWAREVVERQVKHLARLIDDLLDVSRITRGKIQLRKERVDAAPILSSAIDDVRPLVEERKHRLTVSVGPGALWLDADPVRVQQVLVNLLTNAAKYTDAGGEIWLTANREDDQIVIKVRDTGMGIPPDKLPTMFELFAQGERSMARSEGGLGIGLTLVKSLVEMHGGSVSAASKGTGMGSEFTVRLPAAQALTAASEELTGRPATGKGSRVLVVDDNVDTAKGLEKLLKVLGHHVRTVHDGEAAILAAREHRPAFVLLDIGLPGMDGYQVAAQLRQEECCKQSVLIAVTGYGQEQDRRRARESGFDHHLVKPLDYKALLGIMA